MSVLGRFTYSEIGEQSLALAAAVEQLEKQKDWIGRYIADPSFDEVIFVGSGSSYYQAMIMASTYRLWTGRRAAVYPSSEILLFREQAVVAGRRYLLVGVSRSGESTEVILALESVRHLADWTTCGITCYEDSRLAATTDCLLSPFGKESSMVMTKSFCSMTFMMQLAISKAAAKGRFTSELNEAMQLSDSVVKAADPFIKSAIQANDFHNYIYLGMATYYGLSQEACLKLKEMSYVWTEAYGTLEFRHGPKSIVEPGTFICLLVSEHARAHELKVAEEMKAYGAYVMLITAEKGQDTSFADAVFEIGGRHLGDEARTVLYLPAVQYIGYYSALKRNVDPDSPRNLSQVVKF